MAETNLLVTFDPVHKESAKAEIEALMKEIGKKVGIVSVEDGMAELSVDNAKKTIKSLADLCKKDNTKFNYTYNWWPVDKWCKSDLEGMQACIKELEKGIGKEEKWKMDFAKRKTTQKYPKDIIIKLTDVVDKPKVDLKNPDKIIKVEVIGDRAAISLVTSDEILNVPKTKD